MSRFDHLILDHVRAMPTYVPGRSPRQAEAESGVPCIKMASNENPFGPSPLAVEAMQAAAANVNWYPEIDNSDLRAAIAVRHGIDPTNVLVTCGSSQMLHIVARTILAPGLNAITADRSFIVYPIVCMAVGADLIRVPMRDNAFNLGAILDAVTHETRAILIANPNNPTGSMLSPADITRFLDEVPDQVVVVLDEAYAEFAEAFAQQRGVSYSRSFDYVREGRNVVVLRTFSKAQGLAAARIGYAVAPAGLIQYFMRVKTVFSVSSIAEAGALAALGDFAHVEKTTQNNLRGAEYLTRSLAELGLTALPTWTNFLYVDLGEPASPFAKRLEGEGVIVRPMTGNWNAPTAIRVTIGTPEQNAVFLGAMKKVLTSAAVR
ncbi:MAG TPA: histidinol-phosphate transaminase [Terriglobales bacterium]|nr:histidinol-phosphate transaminase [Terriglobales bacterium]